MTFEIKNKAYEEKIQTAIIKAIMETSMVEVNGQRTATLLTGEIVSACLTTIAFVAGSSEATSSPTKIREFADNCAKRIRTRVASAQDARAKGDMDWMEIVEAKDRH